MCVFWVKELPVVEEVCLSLPEDAELHPIGKVSSIIQQLGKYAHSAFIDF